MKPVKTYARRSASPRARSPRRPRVSSSGHEGSTGHSKSPASKSNPKFVGKVTHPLAQFLLSFRWIAILLIVLPLSWLVYRYQRIRDWWLYEVRSHSVNHQQKVDQVKVQLERYFASGSKAKLCTARPSFATTSLRYPSYKGKENAIRLDLQDILDWSEKEEYVHVEPQVTVGRLTHFLIPKGWTLPVVPELDDLTIGGMVNGYGIESTSHVHGLFFDSVLSCEVILANGEVVEATPTNKYKDLFYAISWSHGCLGFLLSVKLRIARAKPYVALQYIPLKGLENIVDTFNSASMDSNPSDTVECLQFSLDEAVLMKGQFVDTVPAGGHINPLTAWYKPWFFTHVHEMGRAGGGLEYVPLRHYYHRHTRGLFWEVEMMVPFGNHPLFLLLLGWLYPPHIGVIKATQGRTLANYFKDMLFVQDILVPCSELKASLVYSAKEYDIWPLWLCPHKTTRTNPSGFLKPNDPKAIDYEMYVDVGIYGIPRQVRDKTPFSQAQASWEIGAWLRERGGYQALYAITEMSREEFEEMYDHTLFHAAKKKYGATAAFPDPYDKISSK